MRGFRTRAQGSGLRAWDWLTLHDSPEKDKGFAMMTVELWTLRTEVSIQ